MYRQEINIRGRYNIGLQTTVLYAVEHIKLMFVSFSKLIYENIKLKFISFLINYFKSKMFNVFSLLCEMKTKEVKDHKVETLNVD